MAMAKEADKLNVIYHDHDGWQGRPEAVILIEDINYLLDFLWEDSVKRATRKYNAVIERDQQYVYIVFQAGTKETFMRPAVEAVLRKAKAVVDQREASRAAHPSNGGLVRTGASRTGHHNEGNVLSMHKFRKRR